MVNRSKNDRTKVDLEVVSTKITKPLAGAIEEYMERDAHVTKSDFVRDAIREKIKRDTPDIYAKLLEPEGGEK